MSKMLMEDSPCVIWTVAKKRVLNERERESPSTEKKFKVELISCGPAPVKAKVWVIALNEEWRLPRGLDNVIAYIRDLDPNYRVSQPREWAGNSESGLDVTLERYEIVIHNTRRFLKDGDIIYIQVGKTIHVRAEYAGPPNPQPFHRWPGGGKAVKIAMRNYTILAEPVNGLSRCNVPLENGEPLMVQCNPFDLTSGNSKQASKFPAAIARLAAAQ
jgi:hypothetical protein